MLSFRFHLLSFYLHFNFAQLHFPGFPSLACKVFVHHFESPSSFLQVASHVLMGLTKNTAVLPTMLSPLGKACARMDLTAVHDILLKTGYKDEEGAENEVCQKSHSGLQVKYG